MVFTSILATDDCREYPVAIRKVIEYLQTNDIFNMEPGTYELIGKDMFVQIMDIKTGTMEEMRPEAHKKYLDIHYLVSGEERFGFTPNTGNYQITQQDVANDMYFYRDVKYENFVNAVPGCLSIFLPCDIHRAGLAVKEPMLIRKARAKVSMELI